MYAKKKKGQTMVNTESGTSLLCDVFMDTVYSSEQDVDVKGNIDQIKDIVTYHW